MYELAPDAANAARNDIREYRYLSGELTGEALRGVFAEWHAMWDEIIAAQAALPPSMREAIEGHTSNEPNGAVSVLRAGMMMLHPDVCKMHRDMMVEAMALADEVVDGSRVEELEAENASLRAALAAIRGVAATVAGGDDPVVGALQN